MDAFLNFLEASWRVTAILTLVFFVIIIALLAVLLVLRSRIRTQDMPVPMPQPTAPKEEPEADDRDFLVDDVGDTVEIQEKSKGATVFIVAFDRPKNNWIIRKKGVERATRRASTKEEAVKLAKELARKYNATLSVHKKDGKFQKQR